MILEKLFQTHRSALSGSKSGLSVFIRRQPQTLWGMDYLISTVIKPLTVVEALSCLWYISQLCFLSRNYEESKHLLCIIYHYVAPVLRWSTTVIYECLSVQRLSDKGLIPLLSLTVPTDLSKVLRIHDNYESEGSNFADLNTESKTYKQNDS